MAFRDYRYERPDFDEVSKEWNLLLDGFRKAPTLDEQLLLMEEISTLVSRFQTMMTLVSIRHSVDTRDEFYSAEQDYADEITPKMMSLLTAFYDAMLKSPHREGLEAKFGKQIFRLAEMQQRSFSDDIIEELQEENRLTSAYGKLIASAEIEFDGKTLTLAQIDPYTQSPDRTVRKAAVEAKFSFFAEHEEEFDRIYDALVQVRDKMAKKLGYKNFIELAYLRMNRSDYGAEEVAAYRKQVLDHLVPLHTKLRQRQADRLGLESLKFYDEGFHFANGNAKPQGDAEWMIERTKTMYHELSPETAEFIDRMLEEETMDLLAKPGKESGGYCTYLPEYKIPFIFANFNGTSDDVDTLTHEVGHAFQSWCAGREVALTEYLFPTYEAAEIHSMSMEFFAWPWMDSFFGDQIEKYKFMHLSGSLLFIPYGVTVDHFQHFVYENPQATPAERKSKWRELEALYLPSRDYDGIEYLERGGFWMRQGHIFQSPFYYIDYTLAQVLALQFWVKDQVEHEHESAWADYLNLCKAGGSLPFLELVELGNLDNPFTEGSIAKITPAVEAWLDQVDDKALN